MIADVRELLKDSLQESILFFEAPQLFEEHGAKATFFLCSDYVAGFEDEAKTLLADGHEFANHCPVLGTAGLHCCEIQLMLLWEASISVSRSVRWRGLLQHAARRV